MVTTALRNVRGRLCQRSDPEPIGCSAESNQPHVIPLGADNSCSQIAGFWSPVIAAKCAFLQTRTLLAMADRLFRRYSTDFETGNELLRRTHNLCDRPVPSVINSVSWLT